MPELIDDFDPVCDSCQQPIPSTELKFIKIDNAGLMKCKLCQESEPQKFDDTPFQRKEI